MPRGVGGEGKIGLKGQGQYRQWKRKEDHV
jgi:hypothetical protein